jgi:tRNA/tmRNA/rRNA uracil-C5-methylase (TrmA/RlmC/RlmD family)
LSRKVDPTPFEARVVDLAADGRGVARLAGKTVFIADALPGERVMASRVSRRRSHDEAVLVEVLEPVGERVMPARALTSENAAAAACSTSCPRRNLRSRSATFTKPCNASAACGR